ncbi:MULTISPECIES: ABC transporter permease [unclassified Rhodococcus (in: high G+C Gram-positive bacteria)]|uniref:ABC transporter permease n=1 Tax=unclassified Rhodococcus (in: high G+C Gram-positive bacteria) TaxID=192944 RepID=UPI0004883A2F|nr:MULTISPECIES: ABC transporter permease [unclassified Rhodococcus (in: high G+C Gram-positive bacteria)]MBY6706006.1 ABC transporter permease [Rhodococcus sp. BP-241]MDQ1178986.1 ABC-2 type transport system permease protein [Rhodococcus sp. SORGH_AS_0301]
MTDTASEPRFDLRALPEPERLVGERSLAGLASQSVLHCGRLLRRWARDPLTIIQAVVYPVVFLLMLRTVLGNSVSAATGENSIFGTVPLIAMVAAMSGSLASAVGLRRERAAGLVSRFQTLPVHRAAGLVGRLLAETARIVTTTLLIVVVGFTLGFRFEQGPVPGVLAMLVPLAFGLGFAVFVTSAAIVTTTFPLVEAVGMVFTILMFFNSGFVPTRAYPTWLQPFVEHNPISCAVDSMKGLTLGGPVTSPLLQSLAWSFGLFLVFVGPAVRGYRRAAETF